MKPGDLVITKDNVWHEGIDISCRVGKVISTHSYIVVDLLGYNNNPVKCFSFDLELLDKYLDVKEEKREDDWFSELEVESLLDDLDKA